MSKHKYQMNIKKEKGMNPLSHARPPQ